MQLLSVASLAVVVLVAAQPVPLPNTSDVFLRVGSPTAQVLLEAHVDLMCPDCAAAEPTLQQIAQHYGGDQLQLVYHLFPLPYHTWAFTAAFGGNIIRNLNGTDAAVAAWKNYMFGGGQQNFWADAIMNLTNTEVQNLFGTTAAAVTGVSAAAFVDALNNDDNTNEATRISWKFGCQRTVTGTPSFFVNGLPVQADATWTLAQWQQILDPLFTPSTGLKSSKPLSGYVSRLKAEL